MRDRLRELRKANGWTQEDLAKELGLGRSTVNRWERGKHPVDVMALLVLAEKHGWTGEMFAEAGPRPRQVVNAPLTGSGAPNATGKAGKVAELPSPAYVASGREVLIRRAISSMELALQDLRAAVSEQPGGRSDEGG